MTRGAETAEPPGRDRRASTAGLASWALFDWANSAFPTVVQTFVFAAYFTRSVAKDETTGTAQWGNTMSAASLVVAITAPVLGAIADHRGRRKRWIALFSLLCIVATGFLWFVRPGSEGSAGDIWLGLFLVGIATVGAELANVFYNAMLPDLASSERIGRWSGWGWGIGYAGGLASLVLVLFAFVGEDPWIPLETEGAKHVRASFPLVSAWFVLFSLPLFLITPDVARTGKTIGRAARDGLRQLRDSAREVRKYAPLVRFLVARMVYIDGLVTLFVLGGVYAAGTFDMTEEEVLLFGIAINVTAGMGSAAFAWIDDRVGPKKTILASLAGLIVPSFLILVLESKASFWTLGLVLGIFVGPAQAASRSFMARAAPPALENQMFGLFALSGKATSFLGPLLVGWVTYLTGSQRIGMGAISALFLAGFALMLTVPEAEETTRKPRAR